MNSISHYVSEIHALCGYALCTVPRSVLNEGTCAEIGGHDSFWLRIVAEVAKPAASRPPYGRPNSLLGLHSLCFGVAQ